MRKSKAVEFLEDYENDEEAEFIELEEDIELYEGSRDPITVSYVTEDGKEVFQMVSIVMICAVNKRKCTIFGSCKILIPFRKAL